MRNHILRALAIGFIVSIGPTVFAQNLLLNPGFDDTPDPGEFHDSDGDFEALDETTDHWTQLGPLSTGEDTAPFDQAWQFGIILGSNWENISGPNSRHMGAGSGAGGTFQEFATEVGQFYTVTFYASGFPDDTPLHRGFVTAGPPADPAADLDGQYLTPAGNIPREDMGWHGPRTFGFVASTTNTRLTFRSPGPTAPELGSITLDDVSVEATAPFLHEDVDDSGSVDLGDYQIILNNQFMTDPALRADGDLNWDTLVNLEDFRIWKDAFLAAGGSAEGLHFIPEPSSLLLVFGASVAILCRSRRRSQ